MDSGVSDHGYAAAGAGVIERLRQSLRGRLIVPADAGYERARRVWNWMMDRRPALIVRSAETRDVVLAVETAHSLGLPVAVRGGGHSFAGKSTCDGGIVIDLSAMKGIRVDPVARTAVAEPGLTLGELDRATQAHALATPLGTVPQTGIAGLTLGGGVGWLNGKHGLSCDNLLSAEVVTADGRTLVASEHENPDLLWGLRGGGGNFGVVTRFEYRLHPVTHAVAGTLAYVLKDTRRVLRVAREVADGAPDELMIYAGVGPSAGEPRCIVYVCHFGDPAQSERLIAPLRSVAVTDSIRPIPYLDLQNLLFDGFFGHRIETAEFEQMRLSLYAKAGFVRELGDGLIEAMAEGIAKAPSPGCFCLAEFLHGAVCRVPVETTAFPRRENGYDIETVALWQDPAHQEAAVEWIRGYWRTVEPYLTGDAYVNHLAYDDDDRVKAAYGVNYDRLVELKNEYDPTNFYRMNHNIRPTGVSS
jgi:FAD/FMN-containing dehydrogenase